MTDIREFIASKDQPVLRTWLKAVFDKYEISEPPLARQVHTWIDDNKRQLSVLLGVEVGKLDTYKMSRQTLKRFMQPEMQKADFRCHKQMKGVWLYLASHYMELFPEPRAAETKANPLFESPDDLLALALNNFFCETKDITHQLKQMISCLPGRYVMYRLNMEPALYNDPPNDSVRTSLIEITAADIGLRIKETQDFKDPPSPHYQVNNGVIFPYGDFMLAIMNGAQKASFKCLVFDNLLPVSERFDVKQIRGKILVASYLGSVPSVKFVCKRVLGTTPEKHGIYPFDAIDKDIKSYLLTPTLDKKYGAIS